MNREEKRQLVIKLFKEGKTMREICKVVHMSFGDIGSITRKENEEKNPKRMEKSQESQALKLFKKGKDPVDVVISLDLSPSKAAEIYKEFWELKGLYGLLQLFEKIKHDISLLLRVYEIVKKYDLTKKDIINIVKYADEYDFLKEEIEELGGQFSSLLKQRHDANDSLQSAKYELERVTNDIDTYNEISDQKKVQIENWNNEIELLENSISQLKDNNEYYSKFEKFAKEKLDSIIKDHRRILTLAIAVVIESLRKVPNNQLRFDSIIESDESFQAALLDLSEKLFEKLSSQIINHSLQPTLSTDTNHHEPAVKNAIS
jgi:methyl-accepting chemotaxis protein